MGTDQHTLSTSSACLQTKGVMLTHTNLSPDVLTAFVSERLVIYKPPSHIIMTTELSAAATGKVLKHQLLSIYARQLALFDSEV